ncbi:glutamate--cysteine ligase, partial [Neisseria gonorrhoeae]
QWDSLGMPRSEKDCDVDNEHNRLYVYGVMARLSLLAASIELEETA